MHQFTDPDIFHIEVATWFCEDGQVPVKVVYFGLDNQGEGPPTAALSKEDLLYLLKLIEETN